MNFLIDKRKLRLKQSVLKKALKYFTRNEISITGEDNKIHKRSLSVEIVNQIAKDHKGIKIYK